MPFGEQSDESIGARRGQDPLAGTWTTPSGALAIVTHDESAYHSPMSVVASVSLTTPRLDAVALSSAITDGILSGEHAYAERSLPRSALEGVVRDNVVALLGALDGAPIDLDSARRTGRFKAEAGIPLAGVMHAYRIAGLQIWREIGILLEGNRDAGAQFFDLASRTWSLLDQLSTAAAEAHHEVTDTRGRWDEQSRIAAALDLLEGVAAPERHEGAARILGLEEPGRFAVVAIDAVPHGGRPPKTSDEPRAQWVDRRNVRLALVALGPSAPPSWVPDWAERLGISREFSLLKDAPEAARQAILALRGVAPRGRGRARYGDLPVETLVVSHPQAALEAADQVLGRLDDLPPGDRDSLIDTLTAWIDSGGSSAEAAVLLHCHRNTVLYRLRRIEALTGRSVSKPADIAALTIAILARSHLG